MDQLLYMKYERGIETKQKERTKKNSHTKKNWRRTNEHEFIKMGEGGEREKGKNKRELKFSTMMMIFLSVPFSLRFVSFARRIFILFLHFFFSDHFKMFGIIVRDFGVRCVQKLSERTENNNNCSIGSHEIRIPYMLQQ